MLINVSRGPLGIYSAIFDNNIEPTVIVADFPLKWTVAGMDELIDEGINAVVTSQRAIPAHLLEPKIKNRSRIHYQMANIEASNWKGKNNWALLLDPDNEIVKGKKANFLSGVPTIPAHDSVYEIKFRITVRDSSGSLISVSESTNTRYLPYEITDEVFAKGFDMIDTVMIDGTLHEKVKKFESGMTISDRTGMFSITTTLDGYLIDIFQAFTPMIIIEKDDVATIEWTILKEIT